MQLSFVIPLKNEEESIAELVKQIRMNIDSIPGGLTYEIILVDDGSDDSSWNTIKMLSSDFPDIIKGIKLRRNFGKATALAAGFSHVTGDVVFTMDADLQDDPKEIPYFLEKLEEGYDLVSGWKKRRHDPFSKTAPSKLFNWVTSRMTGVKLHDFNCGFKCYKREVIDQLKIYGELHRYLPVLAADLGYSVGEIEVKHHTRQSGVSKYGWERYLRGLLDLLTVLATTRWLQKPGHLFGGIGAFLGICGSTILIYLIVLWFIGLGPIGNRPLLLFGVMLCIFSLQMVSLGVIAEFFIKLTKSRRVDILVAQKSGFPEPQLTTLKKSPLKQGTRNE